MPRDVLHISKRVLVVGVLVVGVLVVGVLLRAFQEDNIAIHMGHVGPTRPRQEGLDGSQIVARGVLGTTIRETNRSIRTSSQKAQIGVIHNLDTSLSNGRKNGIIQIPF